MSEIPPGYANYPRNTPLYGSAVQLQSLYDAYRRYGWIFVANIFLGFGIAFGAGMTGEPALVWLSYLVIATIFGFLTYPLNKKIGFGANWSNGQVIGATIAMAFNSVCCGIVGYIVMQQIAANHIKRYGIKSGFFGIKKTAVQQKVAELEEMERSGQPLG